MRCESAIFTLGPYDVLAPLGRGSMAVVYLARHREFGHHVAIKRLMEHYASDAVVTRRLLGEARVAAQVRHPGMIDVFESGIDAGGNAFVVMELLHGENLEARMAREQLDVLTALAIGRQLAATLDAAHDAGIVHRDLKPDNVHLSLDPITGALRVKVLDFGIAKFTDDNRTRVGRVLGTPAYMSPEQCRGASSADARSDIYSLGCVLYQMVTACVPFDGNLMGVMFAHIETPPTPPRQLAPTLPKQLNGLILQMLAKNPSDRPQNMREVDRALGSLEARLTPSSRATRTRRWALALAITVMLSAIGASVASLVAHS